jgi:hypothetical protein
MNTTLSSLRRFYIEHRWFLALLLLFAGFRFFAILLFRPGGFIADNSDYEFYYAWGLTLPMGYTTFENLWTAYPPLFPALMLPVFVWASHIPPWVEPRLAFHVLFGLELLFFEIGNFVLIYRLARRLEAESDREDAHRISLPLKATVFYALLFAPVYTLLGWFESMPLFFLLLGLELLLVARRWGWLGSAVAAGLGFLVKLTPILLVPVAVRWLGARLSVDAARREWFDPKSPGNLLRPALYVALFAVVVVAVGYPLARFNPTLALSSLRVNSIRPPWQSVWALLDGYYGFGLVPIDMRNLKSLAAGGQWETQLPWGLITLTFLAAYLWLYTRRYDWTQPRTPIAFTAVSVIWLFLYSKGWSPQFVVWIAAFVVLLAPSLRGMLVVLALTVLNFLEAQIYLILLPDETWIMVFTVLLRTALLVLLAGEFLGAIWPAGPVGVRLARYAKWGTAIVLVGVVVGVALGFPRGAQAYWERRLAEHPCRDAIALLSEASSAGVTGPTIIATPQMEVWRDLYPWLHGHYDIRIVEGYNPDDRPAAEVMAEKLQVLARVPGGVYWLEQGERAAGEPASEALDAIAVTSGAEVAESQVLGACRLTRVALPVQP